MCFPIIKGLKCRGIKVPSSKMSSPGKIVYFNTQLEIEHISREKKGKYHVKKRKKVKYKNNNV